MRSLIRSVKPPEIAAVSLEIGAIQEAEWSSVQILSSLEDPAARVWIAEGREGSSDDAPESDGVAVQGFVIARRIIDVLEIDLVAVRRSMRRCGIARALLGALIEGEVRSGLAEARLELASANEAARLLYEGLGFVVVGRRTRYYPDGDDALLLSRPTLSS